MKEEYALGKNGEIYEIVSKEEFVRRFPNEHLEIDPREDTFCPAVISIDASMCRSVERIYKDWGKFGPNGDVIGIIQPYQIVTFISRRAFPKPALAVDCVIFVRDEGNNYFFVGIRRSKDPGKGKSAFVGGFIDVDGYEMETTLEAVLREVSEEVGLEMIALEHMAGDFISDNVPLVVFPNSGGAVTGTDLRYVGDIETGDEEKLEHLGVKRVHRTFVYTCLIDLPEIQTAETVREYFKAGSDAAELAVQPFSSADPESVRAIADSFGLSHHRKMFPKALALVTK